MFFGENPRIRYGWKNMKERRKLKNAKIGILMGSESDLDKMQQAAQVLEEMEAAYEMKILSAHRAWW